MSDIEYIFDEREREVLHEAMKRDDMSAEGVVRHFFRMGQLVDHFFRQGYKLAFRKGNEIVDPLDSGPKMASIPDLSRWSDEGGAPPAQLSCGCDVGTCICDFEKD